STAFWAGVAGELGPEACRAFFELKKLLIYARRSGIYQSTSRIDCDGVIRKGCPDFFALMRIRFTTTRFRCPPPSCISAAPASGRHWGQPYPLTIQQRGFRQMFN